MLFYVTVYEKKQSTASTLIIQLQLHSTSWETVLCPQNVFKNQSLRFSIHLIEYMNPRWPLNSLSEKGVFSEWKSSHDENVPFLLPLKAWEVLGDPQTRERRSPVVQRMLRGLLNEAERKRYFKLQNWRRRSGGEGSQPRQTDKGEPAERSVREWKERKYG